MQRIGKKSKLNYLDIRNNENPVRPFTVIIQANKNDGICGLYLGQKIEKEIMKEFKDFKGRKRTKIVKKYFYKPVKPITECLSDFQGRHFADNVTVELLRNALIRVLNPINE